MAAKALHACRADCKRVRRRYMDAALVAADVATHAVAEIRPNASPSARASSNVLINGDFSDGVLGQSWTPLYAGSKAIVGWHVIAPVDYVSSAYWQTADASRSIDLDGTPGPGAIAQTFPTVPHDTYVVRFKISANTEGPPKVKHVRVTVGGTTRTYSIDDSGRSNAAMHYAQASFNFVAPGKTATLEFASLSRAGNWNGAVITSVVVSNGTDHLTGETAQLVPASRVAMTLKP